MATVEHDDEEVSTPSDFPRQLQILPQQKTTSVLRSFSVPHIDLPLEHHKNKSVVVFDLRCVRRFAKVSPWKLPEQTPISERDIKSMIADHNKTSEGQVHIQVLNDSLQSTFPLTLVIILPQQGYPDSQLVVLGVYDSIEKRNSELMCGRVWKHMIVCDLANLVAQELGWKGAVICMNDIVVNSSVTIQSFSVGVLMRVQVVKHCTREVSFIFQPKRKVHYTYTMDIDMISSVSVVKEKFLKEFADDLLVQNMTDEDMLHLVCNDGLLEDHSCVWFPLSGYKYKTIQMHIASKNAVCITFHYREQKGKLKFQRYQLVSVKPDCSTSDIREEAAKYLNVDPKAVKLTMKNKRIEETENMQESGILTTGVVICVGKKKKKMIQIRNPKSGKQTVINLYMLETVGVLKRAIAEQIGYDEFHMSLQCRGVEMNDSDLLQDYPIKNKMELTMAIHQFRINLRVIILFKNVKLRLVVDDIQTTTVEDVLTFCAQQNRYNRHQSRALYQDRCLNPNHTLEAEGIRALSTMYITFFYDPYGHVGNYFRVLEVRPDGQINARLGTECNGHLFYAPIGVLSLAEDENEKKYMNACLPCGIRVDLKAFEEMSRTFESNEPQKRRHSSADTTVHRAKLPDKKKYLRKAKAICQKKLDKEQTSRKLLELNINEVGFCRLNRHAITDCIDSRKDKSLHITNKIEREPLSYYDMSVPTVVPEVRSELDTTETSDEQDTVSNSVRNNLDTATTNKTNDKFDKNLALSESTTDVNDSGSSHDQRKNSEFNNDVAHANIIHRRQHGFVERMQFMSTSPTLRTSSTHNQVASGRMVNGNPEEDERLPIPLDSRSPSHNTCTSFMSPKRLELSAIKPTNNLKDSGYKTV